ncbi:hypothetical protein GCM10020254_29610 [Streptomyces goshikiensis]
MPAGTGGVGGEHGAGADGLDGGVEAEALLAFQFPYAFEAEEAGVPLVRVEHLGRGMAGQVAVRAHRADAADAEQHLLEEAVVAAAAVEPVGHLAGGGVVVLDVGVEEQQRDPPDAGLPDVRVQRTAAGEAQGHPGRGAVGVPQEGDGGARSGRGRGSAPAASRRGRATAGSIRAGTAARRR